MSYAEYFKIVFSLLGLLLFLFVLLRFSRVVQGKKFTCEIKIKDRCAVDSGVTLMIVEVRGSEYLMGVSNKEIKVLKENI